MRTLACLLLALVITGASAATEKRVRIEVRGEPHVQDLVGQRLIYAVREAIRSSQRLTLVEVPNRPRVMLGFSFIRLGAENNPTGTVAAIVVVFTSPEMPLNGYFMNGWAKSCLAEQVAVCAQEILAMVDRQLDELRGNDPALWKQL